MCFCYDIIKYTVRVRDIGSSTVSDKKSKKINSSKDEIDHGEREGKSQMKRERGWRTEGRRREQEAEQSGLTVRLFESVLQQRNLSGDPVVYLLQRVL